MTATGGCSTPTHVVRYAERFGATPHTRPVEAIARTRPDRCRSRFCARTVGAIQNKLKAGAKPDLVILSAPKWRQWFGVDIKRK
jgi:hypothetical protein